VTLHDKIRQIEQTITPQPLPTDWATKAPALANVPTFGELFIRIRSLKQQGDGDRLIAALLTLPRNITTRPIAPHTAVVIAITRRLEQYYRHAPRWAFDDLITDLTIALCEPELAASIENLDRLTDRLSRRAGSRWTHRYEIDQRHADHTASVDPTTFDTDIAAHGAAFEDTIVSRVALHRFRELVIDSVDRGETTATQWTNFVNGVLAPALGQTQTGQRTNTTRARRSLADQITQALAA
jgi:hypothetical protein